MDYVIGIKANGERIPFERWLYWAWRCGALHDPDLLAVLRSCVTFREV
jgi:hypothetical protein